MKQISAKLLTIVLSLYILSGCALMREQGTEFVGKQAPFARFTLLDGTPVTLTSFRGRKVLIAFWATTCSKSKKTLQKLRDIVASQPKKPNIVVLAASVDRNQNFERVQQKIKELNTSGMQFAFSGNEGDDEAFRAFNGEYIPYFIYIDPRGVVSGMGTRNLEDFFK